MRGVARRRLLSGSVCFTHPDGSYVHSRREQFDVGLGLRVINYVWRHMRPLTCMGERYTCIRGMCVCERVHDRDKIKKT